MKKKYKSLLAFLLALMLIISTFPVAFAAKTEVEQISYFAVSTRDGSADPSALGTVQWWKSDVDGKYYMFLPSKTDLSSVKVWFTALGDVECNGVKLENGTETSVFAKGGEVTLFSGGKNYSVVFITNSKLPTMFINTPEGGLDRIHADKDHKETGCTMLAVNEKGKIDYNSTLDTMKGRGNSTWNRPKKPYNIKLDSKAKLFGMEKAKSWCLLADYQDKTLMRNKIVLGLGADIGMKETPDCRSIDLYINGEYYGVYLITEKVQINKNRVDIYDLEEATEECNSDIDFSTLKPQGFTGVCSGYMEGTQRWYDIPNNPTDITGGYLLELEIGKRYANEPSGFVTNNSQRVVVKAPEFVSKDQVEYISGYWQEMEDALCSDDGYNSLGKHYSEYIDLVSYARQYLIQEWSSNWDAGLTSNYFYKDLNDKIHAGPIWDFDTTLLNYAGRDGVDLTDPTNLHAKSRNLFYNSLIGSNTVKSFPNIYALGFKHKDFVETVESENKNNFIPAAWNIINKKVDKYADSIENAAVMNAIRWNYYETTDVDAIKTGYREEVGRVKDFMTARTEFLSGALTLKNEGLTVTHIPSQKYTGSEITPELTVKCLDVSLVEGIDYVATFSNNIEKGTATVTVTGIGAYDGMTGTATFKIVAISDPLDWTGGSGAERAKENLTKIGARFVDAIEVIIYYIAKPFEKIL